MTNKEVASKFNLLGKLLELHGENPFKTRSYTNAYLSIRKLEQAVVGMEEQDLSALQGIGKAIIGKIQELKNNGSIALLDQYLEKTPSGIVELLGMKGFGPKKIGQVWRELKIESPGELLYACNENRLVDLKGFGEKSQNTLKEQLEFFFDSKGEFLFGHIEEEGEFIVNALRTKFSDQTWDFCSAFEMKQQTLSGIEILTTEYDIEKANTYIASLDSGEYNSDGGLKYAKIPITFYAANAEEFYLQKIKLSSTETFFESLPKLENGNSEEDIFSKAGLVPIPAVVRDSNENVAYVLDQLDDLVQLEDIKGVVHNHSTYSDGLHSLEKMAMACLDRRYEYFVITDHSKAAFYANGLSEERLYEQIAEIEKLNKKIPELKIFSGTECDILNDGRLDYGDDVLKDLDCVIASVHSQLKMDEAKATSRIITAVENPHVDILGHPTGRLLLSRKAYPLDHEKVIDACADNGVAIEINANPYRLDLDFRWLSYAMERGVYISINPDAHAIGGIDDIKYGVFAAQKGLLTKEFTLNARSADSFAEWLNS